MKYIFSSQKNYFQSYRRPAAWLDKNIVDGTMNLLQQLQVKYFSIDQRIYNPVKCRTTRCISLVA